MDRPSSWAAEKCKKKGSAGRGNPRQRARSSGHKKDRPKKGSGKKRHHSRFEKRKIGCCIGAGGGLEECRGGGIQPKGEISKEDGKRIVCGGDHQENWQGGN